MRAGNGSLFYAVKLQMKGEKMAKKDLLIIAGHGRGYSGNYDPGAVSKWGKEADYTRELATMIKNSIGKLLSVDMYDQNKDCYSYSANGQVPDYAMYKYVLEIHFNAKTNKDPNGNGMFTGCGGYYHPYNTGREFADELVNAVASLGFKVWGNFTSTGLLNLNNAQAAGVKYFLLETAFIDDGDDMSWYNARKKEVARTIAQKLIDEIGGNGTAQVPDDSIRYFVRKSWEDKKSQFNAYADLEIAKKNCPIGYAVYDKNGKELYTNKVPIGDDTDNIWMGWTKRETGKDGVRNIHGDNGKAYGLQFDYRYGLIPFLQFCVDYDQNKYTPFKKFIALGAGNSALIYNKELGRLWQQFYDANPQEFEQLQYLCAYRNYYLPAKDYVLNHYGFEMADKSPTVKGTLWSMAFRSGSETAAKKFADCKGMSDIQILNHVYPTYGASDANRWTKAGQWGDALSALETGEYTTLVLHMTDKPDKPQKLPGNDLLSVLLKFQEQLEKDIISDRKWIYSNSGCSSKMSTALKKGNRKCNCALLVRWALRKLGLLNGDNWWGEKGGKIVWKGTSKEQMLKHFDLIHVSGKKTVNQAFKDGTLQAGDIVTYVDMGHTNVYAGNGKWYDGGHAYASGSGEGAVFKSWYGNTVYGSQPIGYILRRKGTEQQTPDQKMYIVREGLYDKKENADRQCKAIKRVGIDCVVKLVDGKYWTQCGVFLNIENAETILRKLRKYRFDAVIK